MYSVIFFIFYVYRATYFAAIYVTIRHRYINVEVPNIHYHVSAVHSVPDAASLDFVTDGFANTNVVQRGEIHILHFSGWLLLQPVLYQHCI